MERSEERYICTGDCEADMKYIQDTLYVISGKWKMLIIVALSNQHKRYNQIAKVVPGITFRMLSKELKDMEQNHLVSRNVYHETPVRIEYEMTEYCKSLWPMMVEMISWAKNHRKVITA